MIWLPSRYYNTIYVIAILVFAYIIVWNNLGEHPVYQWDEARLAVKAAETYQHNNFLVLTYNGEPDLWSVKPPLQIWAITASYHLFGVNEFALRFPSALSVTLCALLLYFLIARITGIKEIGLIASLVLLTSSGYMGYHVGRTGEYDALLTLLITAYSLAFYQYTENKNKGWLLLIAGVGVTLAALTKGIIALSILPALLIYAIAKKHLVNILRSKWFYIAIAQFLLVIAGYYWLRESAEAGYISTVLDEEILLRFRKDIGSIGYQPNPFYYLIGFVAKTRFLPWVFIIPVALYFNIRYKTTFSSLSTFATIIFCFFLVIISVAKVKLTWYDAPLYPFAAIIVSIGVYQIHQHLNLHYKRYKMFVFYICFVGLLALGFTKAYTNNQTRAFKSNPELQFGYYMEHLKDNQPNTKQFKVLHKEYNPHLLFYINKYNLEEYNITKTNRSIFTSDDIIVICEPEYLTELQKTHKVEFIDTVGCYTVKVLD